MNKSTIIVLGTYFDEKGLHSFLMPFDKLAHTFDDTYLEPEEDIDYSDNTSPAWIISGATIQDDELKTFCHVTLEEPLTMLYNITDPSYYEVSIEILQQQLEQKEQQFHEKYPLGTDTQAAGLPETGS